MRCVHSSTVLQLRREQSAPGAGRDPTTVSNSATSNSVLTTGVGHAAYHLVLTYMLRRRSRPIYKQQQQSSGDVRISSAHRTDAAIHL